MPTSPPSQAPRRAQRKPDLSKQLRQMEHRLMTALSDAVAKLSADDTALEGEVDQLIATINGIPAQVAAAAQAALTAAGVDDAAATTALAAIDTAVTAETAKAVAALQPVQSAS